MGIQGTSLLMLPLGFSIGVYINLILHWFDFHQDFPAYTKHVAKTFFQVTSASIIMGFCTYVSLSFFSSLFSLDTFFGVLFQAVCAGGVGILSGVIILIFLKNTEVNEVFTSLHKKFWKAKVVPPDARM
jgi:hypothetical protein